MVLFVFVRFDVVVVFVRFHGGVVFVRRFHSAVVFVGRFMVLLSGFNMAVDLCTLPSG